MELNNIYVKVSKKLVNILNGDKGFQTVFILKKNMLKFVELMLTNNKKLKKITKIIIILIKMKFQLILMEKL